MTITITHGQYCHHIFTITITHWKLPSHIALTNTFTHWRYCHHILTITITHWQLPSHTITFTQWQLPSHADNYHHRITVTIPSFHHKNYHHSESLCHYHNQPHSDNYHHTVTIYHHTDTDNTIFTRLCVSYLWAKSFSSPTNWKQKNTSADQWLSSSHDRQDLLLVTKHTEWLAWPTCLPTDRILSESQDF